MNLSMDYDSPICFILSTAISGSIQSPALNQFMKFHSICEQRVSFNVWHKAALIETAAL